ncbi:MAG: protein kinase domain-containing protein [Actinomycetota bacterium]
MNQPRGERFQRFRHEVALLEKLDERPGPVPLVDCHLPSSPTRRDPAWLAMPIAESLKDHLGDERALEEVVSAIHEIASTLAALAGESIGHRDIKPRNLYWHNGRAVVGDFGLADFPGKDSITVEGRKLGPQYYIAPEMLSDAARASPHPADVYSVAKTLWVLATGQNYPPPGEQRRDTSAVMLSTYIDHPHAHLLDGLIEDATRYDPGMRPDMNTFAADLEAWVAPPGPEAVGPDVSDLGQRIVSDHRTRAAATAGGASALGPGDGSQSAVLQTGGCRRQGAHGRGVPLGKRSRLQRCGTFSGRADSRDTTASCTAGPVGGEEALFMVGRTREMLRQRFRNQPRIHGGCHRGR